MSPEALNLELIFTGKRGIRVQCHSSGVCSWRRRLILRPIITPLLPNPQAASPKANLATRGLLLASLYVQLTECPLPPSHSHACSHQPHVGDADLSLPLAGQKERDFHHLDTTSPAKSRRRRRRSRQCRRWEYPDSIRRTQIGRVSR